MGDADGTPLMRQYREIKQAYRDAILFFRVGDFYEMFQEDAIEASKLLSIALTSRDKSSETPIPLCGVPYHAATNYIAKLLRAGRTVALCEQVEDPKLAKGLVRREVVRLYTPGTLIDSEFLPSSESNVLAAVASRGRPVGHDQTQCSFGLATLEVSTGEYWLCEFHGPQARIAEIVVNTLPRDRVRETIHHDPQFYRIRNHLVDFLVRRSKAIQQAGSTVAELATTHVVRPGLNEAANSHVEAAA